MQSQKILFILLFSFGLNCNFVFSQSLLETDIVIENKELANTLETKLQQYKSETNVTIYSFLIENTEGIPLATYTRQIAQSLEVTPKSADSSIVVVISAEEKKGYIKSSGGLRHLLTRMVLREMIATNPYLEEGKFIEAMDVLTNDLILTIHPYYEVSDIALDDTQDFSDTDEEFQTDKLESEELDEKDSASNQGEKKTSIASYLMWTMAMMGVGILGYAAYYFNKMNQNNMQENITLDSFGSISGNATTHEEHEELDLENFQGGGVEGSW